MTTFLDILKQRLRSFNFLVDANSRSWLQRVGVGDDVAVLIDDFNERQVEAPGD